MSGRLGSWVEVTIPSTRMADDNVRQAVDDSVAVVGGATITEARGFYVRHDNGSTDYEHVFVIRWDFNIESDRYTNVNYAIREVVNSLLQAGEESVLRRRFYANGVRGGYGSSLIFK